MRPSRGHAATLGFVALMLLFAAAVVTATAYHLSSLREAEIRRLQDSAATHARVFEDHLTQTLSIVDLTLRNALDATDAPSPQHLANTLGLALRRAPYLRSLSLLDTSGRIVASANPANVGVAPVLDALLPQTSIEAQLLRLGLPWAGRDFADGRPATTVEPGRGDGLGFIPVVRASSDSTRLLAAMNPDYFINHFLRTLAPGQGSVEVLRYDRVRLFASGDSEDPRPSGVLRRLHGLPDPSSGGREHGITEESLPSGSTKVVAYRASHLYPLTVLVSMDRELALRAWRDRARALLATVIPAFLLSTALAVVAFRRVQRFERERQDEELRAHDRLASRVFDASSEAVVVTDRDNRIVRVNRAYTQLSGYSEAEALGRDPNISRSHHQDSAFYEAMWHEITTRGAWRGELVNRRKDDSCYPVSLSISAVLDKDGRVANYVGIFADITELKAREERIRFLSEHDFLTGLPNRALFQDRVERAIAHARRSGHRLGVLFIDLDRFKPINDTLGHHAGDRLLQEIGRRIAATVRESDTVARQGGDEFLVMLPEIDRPDDLARVAKKIMESIAAPCRLGAHELRVSSSVGISVYPDDAIDRDALIRAADTAMYHSKAQGRAAYQFFSPVMNAAASGQLALEAGLRCAIEQRRFSLEYQPLVDLGDGGITGVEALLRWRDADFIDVPPSRFIPMAEESGLIVQIGEWVLREACRQLREWADQGMPRLTVAVNVSPIQFARAGFLETVRRALEEFGVDGDQLELEVTESMLVGHDETRIATFDALRGLGIRLAIDDFGTGYSSLSYLRRLPIDKIKIDRSFVSDVTSGSEDGLIVGALIDMAHGIGLRVLGEGVETRAQYDFLCDRGCDEAQGYLISPPLPAEALADWLRQGQGNSLGREKRSPRRSRSCDSTIGGPSRGSHVRGERSIVPESRTDAER